MALGKAVINISANLAPLRRGLISAKAAVVSTMSTIGRSITSMAKSLVGGAFRIISNGLKKIISLAKLAAIALIGIIVASVKVAASAEETENLFVESFGELTGAARKWVNEYSKATGLFDRNTKQMVSTFFLMLNSMGIATDKAFEMSKGLVELTVDLASFRDLKIEEAFLKLQSGITGEAEPLKRLGILIGENTLKQFKMRDATLKNKKALSEIDKVMLRYTAILAQTPKAQGDFLRTLDSTTNVFKIVREQIARTAETIGVVFKGDITEIGKVMRDWLINSQDQIKTWAVVVLDRIKSVIEIFKDLATVIKGPGDPTTLAGLQQTGRFKQSQVNLTASFQSAFEVAKTAMRSIFEFVASALEKLKPIAASIGETIGGAIVTGIRKAARSITPIGDVQDLRSARARTRQTERTLAERTGGTVAPVKFNDPGSLLGKVLLANEEMVTLLKRIFEQGEESF